MLCQEWEEVSCDLSKDIEDETGRSVCVRVVEFGRELDSHFSGFGDHGGGDAFAESAEGYADDLGVHGPVGHRKSVRGGPRCRVARGRQ